MTLPKVVIGEATPLGTTVDPKTKVMETMQKYYIKARNAIYVLKITIEEEFLEYINEDTTLKVARGTFAILFSKKNDTHLKKIKTELMTNLQGDMMIN